MRIQYLTLACGPDGVFNPGDQREVSEDVGFGLVEARAAIDITPKQVAVVTPQEVAKESPAEAAVIVPETRGRRKK